MWYHTVLCIHCFSFLTVVRRIYTCIAVCANYSFWGERRIRRARLSVTSARQLRISCVRFDPSERQPCVWLDAKNTFFFHVPFLSFLFNQNLLSFYLGASYYYIYIVCLWLQHRALGGGLECFSWIMYVLYIIYECIKICICVRRSPTSENAVKERWREEGRLKNRLPSSGVHQFWWPPGGWPICNVSNFGFGFLWFWFWGFVFGCSFPSWAITLATDARTPSKDEACRRKERKTCRHVKDRQTDRQEFDCLAFDLSFVFNYLFIC